MNRKKWQGLTCILLASLMMGSTFASSTRNAAPKPVETPKQIEAPKATPVPQPAVPKAAETPKPVETPKTSAPKTTIPEAVKSPKVTVPKTALPKEKETPKASQAPKAAQPKASETPKVPETPKAPEAPKKQETVPPKAQPAAPPKCAEPKTPQTPVKEKTVPKTSVEIKKEEKPEAPIQKKETKCPSKAQKPFTLDHFKMIVCTLKQLGMEDDEIVTYIKEGKKLEDILSAEKISARKFKKCILKQYCKAIDEGVKEGQITKEQAKQLKTAIKDTVKNWLPKK